MLPLAPLDTWLHSEALGDGARRFFAYAFPDPTLSLDVSLIPHEFNSSGDDDGTRRGSCSAAGTC